MSSYDELLVKRLRKMAQTFEGKAHEAGELDASIHWSEFAENCNDAANYIEKPKLDLLVDGESEWSGKRRS